MSNSQSFASVRTDVVVIGSGVAGLSTALRAAAGRRVALLSKDTLLESNTAYAQGGVAAAIGPDDSPAEHLADTLKAGADLCESDAVAILVNDGPQRVQELIALGARFDTDASGRLQLGREGAHSHSRILHAGGDATGAEIAATLGRHVRAHPNITVFERVFAADLWIEGSRCRGVWAFDGDGRLFLLTAGGVVLATGGAGQVYKNTTNPFVATGDGFAMAHRAGAKTADMEFVQFHPTALALHENPMVLISEAVRGEGATLLDERGERFMTAEHPLAELAPRDVVARAIFAIGERGGEVFLDATHLGEHFPDRFPTIFKACQSRGIDPRVQPIPVSPAAHFIMGGVYTDTSGRTGVPGLYACGEVACTGVHGANRLASNSLLEGLVFAQKVAEAVMAESDEARPAPECAPEPLAAARGLRRAPHLARTETAGGADVADEVRNLMWRQVGIVRHATGLNEAIARLETLAEESPATALVLRNMIDTALLIARAALGRQESRGGHYRSDYPEVAPDWRRRVVR
ncbi:MAG TPA: L-aspartate oxidase [Limnochordia bacterium]|nr:L-aspartate oxidase [Limnochordia bacterium]